MMEERGKREMHHGKETSRINGDEGKKIMMG